MAAAGKEQPPKTNPPFTGLRVIISRASIGQISVEINKSVLWIIQRCGEGENVPGCFQVSIKWRGDEPLYFCLLERSQKTHQQPPLIELHSKI